MTKYHISPKTGNPNRCYASVKPCPVGGADEHYPTKEAARDAFEKSQSEGGQTVTKLKKNSGEEKTSGAPATITSIGGKAITPEMTEKYQTAVARRISTTPPLNKTEEKTLQDVADGKKVSDEKLDALIDRLRHTDKVTPYSREGDAEAGAAALSYLKAVRSKSPNPSTLKDVNAFDPATQTVFSNKDARRDPMIAGKAIRRTGAHIEWMNQLADQDRAYSNDPTCPAEEREQYRNSAAQYADEVLRSEAKLQAQLKELQYQYDNDETFRNNTKLGIARYLKDGFYRGTNDKYRDVPLEGVKKA